MDRGLGLEPGTSVSVEFALELAQQIHGVARYEDGATFSRVEACTTSSSRSGAEPKFRIARSSIRTDEEGRFTSPLEHDVPAVDRRAGCLEGRRRENRDAREAGCRERGDRAGGTTVVLRERSTRSRGPRVALHGPRRCRVSGGSVAAAKSQSRTAGSSPEGPIASSGPTNPARRRSVNVEVPTTGALHLPLHVEAPKGSSGR